jgi:MFS family permease
MRLTQLVLASAIGSALEWYDFFIYGTAAALVFPDLFFPKLDATVGTLAAYATFGAGFLVRPLGGLCFGHIGDRYGRKPALLATLFLVGGGTFLIGLLPTHASIGVWAPVLLLLLRLAQGFGAGAEYGGAVILAVEYAPPGRRGFFGSFAPMGVVVGNLAAAGVFGLVALLGDDVMRAWGWRIPFLVSILLLGLGVYIRWRIAETPVFDEVSRKRPPLRFPGLDAVRRHPRNFLVVIGARLAENGLGYLFPVFGLGYIVKTLQLPRGVGLTGVILGNVAELIGVFAFSVLSDRIGRRPVYLGGALFSLLFAIPFFLLVNTKDPALIALAFILVMGVGGGAMFGPQAAYFAELFGPRLRYSGFAFARELGSVLAGGPAPFIAALLVAWSAGEPWGVAEYVIILSLLTAAAIVWGPETHRSEIDAEAVEPEEAAAEELAAQ